MKPSICFWGDPDFRDSTLIGTLENAGIESMRIDPSPKGIEMLTDNPHIAVVMSDADDFERAHPCPVKLASTIMSFSTANST